MLIIKAGIDASGYRTAVRDYTEPSVVEELAANSYDADSTTCVVLLDTAKGQLHVIDDGIGFSQEAIESIGILGAGSKTAIPYSKGKRHYLGSYGYGLKSSLNIAERVSVRSVSEDGEFAGILDWSKLEDALRPDFPGFNFAHTKRKSKQASGTHITLSLKSPPSVDQLQELADVLANLPNDGGKFLCCVGKYDDFLHRIGALDNFAKIKPVAQKLANKRTLTVAESSRQVDLHACDRQELLDKQDHKVRATFFFAGIDHGKVKQLKRGLRGIYVRIHGRLLKQSFTDSKFTYNISRWKKFESGLRVEISVDWLRDQISLSREGVRFGNAKLEEDFKSLLARLVGRFIQPQLKKLEQKAAKEAARKGEQRLELANKRVKREKSILVPGLTSGFPYRPETDGELVLILAQAQILKCISPSLSIIDYNDKAPYDCVLYDKSTRKFVNAELEPTLVEWLEHKETDDVEMIITWTLGKWRIGAKKRGAGGLYKLVDDGAIKKHGRYKLLEYAGDKSKTPRSDYKVIVLDEIVTK